MGKVTRPKGTRHVLLFAVGTGEAKRTEYTLGARTVVADFPCLALLEAETVDPPTAAIALLTSHALTSPAWSTISRSLTGRPEFDLRSCEVTSEFSAAEVRRTTDRLLAELDRLRPHRLSVDLTQGPRHVPVTALLLASSLRATSPHVKVSLYYGFNDTSVPGEARLEDLGAVLLQMDWWYALRAASDALHTEPAARLLDDEASRLGKTASPEHPSVRGAAGAARNAAAALRELGHAWRSGLPLEAGRVASRLDDLRASLESEGWTPHFPLAARMIQALAADLGSLRLKHPAAADRRKWKHTVELDAPEIERQREFTLRQLEIGAPAAAFGAAREWIVTWLLHGAGGVHRSRWLDRAVREVAERALNEAAEPSAASTPSDPDLARVGSLWSQVRDSRNHLQHQAMNADERPLRRLRELAERLRTKIRDLPDLPPASLLPLPVPGNEGGRS